MENNIMCPLVDDLIKDIDCIENIDCVEGIQKETSMPKKYKVKANWNEICKNCKYHDIDK